MPEPTAPPRTPPPLITVSLQKIYDLYEYYLVVKWQKYAEGIYQYVYFMEANSQQLHGIFIRKNWNSDDR
jgi:hypothetical protein